MVSIKKLSAEPCEATSGERLAAQLLGPTCGSLPVWIWWGSVCVRHSRKSPSASCLLSPLDGIKIMAFLTLSGELMTFSIKKWPVLPPTWAWQVLLKTTIVGLSVQKWVNCRLLMILLSFLEWKWFCQINPQSCHPMPACICTLRLSTTGKIQLFFIKTSFKSQHLSLLPPVLTCSFFHLFPRWFLLSPTALSFFQADEDEVSVNINHSA